MTPKLRIKCKHEESVLKGMYLAGAVKAREFLRFSEVAVVQSFVYHKIKKSRLQTVLERLVKRGWVEKKQGYSISGLTPNESSVYDIILYKERDFPSTWQKPKVYFPSIHKKIWPRLAGKGIKARISLSKKLFRRELPKRYSFYKIVKYPFFFSVNGENINFVPSGTKKFWLKSAKKLRDLRKSKAIPLWLPTPTKTKIIKEGKVKETKLKILEIKDGKYKVQDPQTREIIEVNESEIIGIPTKH